VTMEKEVTFNNISRFMQEKEKSVLTQIAMRILLGVLSQIVQLFFVRDVKNNKVDRLKMDIYIVF